MSDHRLPEAGGAAIFLHHDQPSGLAHRGLQRRPVAGDQGAEIDHLGIDLRLIEDGGRLFVNGPNIMLGYMHARAPGKDRKSTRLNSSH